MKFNKIILAGGSGYIGGVLSFYYGTKAKEIVVFTRGSTEQKGHVLYQHWDGKTPGEWTKHLEGTDMLINLTGKSVNCRYHAKNRKEILDSRLDATEALGNAIAKCTNPPKVWIQCASATIYRHAEDRPMDEETGEIGSGFSVEVCKAWEACFWKQNTPNTRKVLLRTAIVMGNSDGVLVRLKNLTKYGLGGKQGNGKQMVSWIHDQDLARLTEWIYNTPNASGIYNASAPHPLKNAEMMQSLKQQFKPIIALPAPKWLLEIGARIIGTETELVLKSRWVIPKRLKEEGFAFEYNRFEECL